MNNSIVEKLKSIRVRLESAEFERFEDEIELAATNIGSVILQMSEQSQLMHAYYRCRSCGFRWEKVDHLAAAEPCSKCGQETDCFHSCAVGDEDRGALFRAMAKEERAFPMQSEKGGYTVTVGKMAVGDAEIMLEAVGMGDAAVKAMEKAIDHEFETPEATFFVQDESDICFEPTEDDEEEVALVDGREYYWKSPDVDDDGEDPSCFVKLVMQGNPLCIVRGPDEELFEVPADELC